MVTWKRLGSTLLISLSLLEACQPKQRLQDFVDVNTIDSVEIYNNSGQHWMTQPELQDFKSRLKAMVYQPKIRFKPDNSAGLRVYMRGNLYFLWGRGQWLEIPNDMVSQHWYDFTMFAQDNSSLVFEFDRPTNLLNYRAQSKASGRR